MTFRSTGARPTTLTLDDATFDPITHAALPRGFTHEADSPFDIVKTLHDVWESTCSRHSDLPCLAGKFC